MEMQKIKNSQTISEDEEQGWSSYTNQDLSIALVTNTVWNWYKERQTNGHNLETEPHI